MKSHPVWRRHPPKLPSFLGPAVERRAPSSRAALIRSIESTVKGQTSYAKQGNFYVSFSIVVTNP
jgi:hypothetical protein